MTMVLRVMLICASVLTTVMMMRKIRHSKVQIEDSLFWVLFSLLLVVLSVFPGLADAMAGLVGTMSTVNFIFLFIIFILMVKLFNMTIKMSQLETRLKELVQRIALDEKKRQGEYTDEIKNKNQNKAE